jgi:hypothetical protein
MGFGPIPALGGWDTPEAVALSSSGSGTNRSYTTGGSSGYTTSDTWK